MIPYSIIMDMRDGTYNKAVIKALLKFAGCVPLLQSITGSSYTSHALNAVCWFLSTLFICYMVCPILVNIISKIKISHSRVIVCIGIVITWLWLLLLRALMDYALGKGLGFAIQRFIDIVVCTLLLSTLAMGKGLVSNFLSSNVMIFLGRNSWEIFLWHFPVICYVDLLLQNETYFGFDMLLRIIIMI